MKRTRDGCLRVDFRKASVAETVSFLFLSLSFLFFFSLSFLSSPWNRKGRCCQAVVAHSGGRGGGFGNGRDNTPL